MLNLKGKDTTSHLTGLHTQSTHPSTRTNTEEDSQTLLHPSSASPEVHHDGDGKRHLKSKKDRKASVAPSSEPSETGRGTTAGERSTFTELMEKSKTLTPEEFKKYLQSRPQPDGVTGSVLFNYDLTDP